MAKVASLCVVLSIVIVGSKAILTDQLVDYSVSIIEYLATQQIGTFKAIFYDLSDDYPMDGDFDKILKSPRLDHISKFVMDESCISTEHPAFPQNPSIIVINLHSQKVQWDAKIISPMFTIINPNTKLLFFTDRRFYASFSVFLKRLADPRQYTNVIFIETTVSMVFRIGFGGQAVEGFNLIHPQYLYRNILRNMNGRLIKFTSPGGVSYRDVNWMAETAEYLNATARYLKNPCPVPESVSLGPCYSDFLASNNIVVSLIFITLKDLPPALYRMLFDVKLETFLVAVPQPRRVNIFEIFLWPFTWGSWIMLILILVLIELVYIFCPRVFRNDPILLFVCGLECYNLHCASTREKILFLPLIIFFFLMLNAYETRIISFMINKPSIGKLHTIHQLIESGMLLKAHAESNPKLFEDRELASIVRDSTEEKELQFDGVNAYCLNSWVIHATLRIASSHGYHSNYYILDEHFGLSVGSYWMPHRDGLLEIFAHIQRWLFENGILDKWANDDMEYIILHYEKVYELLNVMGERFSVSKGSDILDIQDLLPAWLALGVGLLVSFLVFLGEKKFKLDFDRK